MDLFTVKETAATVTNAASTVTNAASTVTNVSSAATNAAASVTEGQTSGQELQRPEGPVAFPLFMSLPPPNDEEEEVASHDLAAILKAIKSDNVKDFLDSIGTERDADNIGSIIHGITLEGCNNVLHEAVKKRAKNVVIFICSSAPFLMSKRNSTGETVWHIAAAAENVPSRAIFNALYDTHQSLKANFENACSTNLLINGVRGNMVDELSITSTEYKFGNTALHFALLHNNFEVARKLHKADPKACYRRNRAQKSPMTLALENGDAELFRSMLDHVVNDRSNAGRTAIGYQKSMFLSTAIERKLDDSIINLIKSIP